MCNEIKVSNELTNTNNNTCVNTIDRVVHNVDNKERISCKNIQVKIHSDTDSDKRIDNVGGENTIDTSNEIPLTHSQKP